jgi:hypothetical protein
MREIRTSGLMSGIWKRKKRSDIQTPTNRKGRKQLRLNLIPPRQISTLLHCYWEPKFGGCQLRLEVEAVLADGLQSIVPGLESDERRSIGSGVVNQFTSHANGKVKGGRLEWRMAVHELLDVRLAAQPSRAGTIARTFPRPLQRKPRGR